MAWLRVCPQAPGFYWSSDGDLITIVEVSLDEERVRPITCIGFIGALEIVPSSECRGQYWD
jgi:hypothetical protein